MTLTNFFNVQSAKRTNLHQFFAFRSHNTHIIPIKDCACRFFTNKNFIFFSFLVVICCFDNVSGAIQMQKTRAYLKKYTGTSTLPVVPNAEKCGGCGSYSEVRTQGCRISDDMCTIPSGRDVQIEIDYIPAKDARILSLKVDVTVPGNDPEIIFDAPILNSSVKRGGKYTIEIHAAASTALRGQKVKVKYQLIGEDGSLKLCMEAEAWMD